MQTVLCEVACLKIAAEKIKRIIVFLIKRLRREKEYSCEKNNEQVRLTKKVVVSK